MRQPWDMGSESLTRGFAGTLNIRSTRRLLQAGHSTVSPLLTRDSKSCRHFRHVYSYKGMAQSFHVRRRRYTSLARKRICFSVSVRLS